ncbi:hypothetical protein [Risungbinella massiliensis]|uniref:hypothetical protein n=1 Tax=Risungbinella massiliensis TaxID=1329796 RepID=UPI0005CB9418|nr:hypothetical protein [Risungbinella massiliensis]
MSIKLNIQGNAEQVRCFLIDFASCPQFLILDQKDSVEHIHNQMEICCVVEHNPEERQNQVCLKLKNGNVISFHLLDVTEVINNSIRMVVGKSYDIFS